MINWLPSKYRLPGGAYACPSCWRYGAFPDFQYPGLRDWCASASTTIEVGSSYTSMEYGNLCRTNVRAPFATAALVMTVKATWHGPGQMLSIHGCTNFTWHEIAALASQVTRASCTFHYWPKWL